MKCFSIFIIISFFCSFNCAYASALIIRENQQTITDLPRCAVAQLPDGSYSVIVEEQKPPLRYYDVIQLYTGRLKYSKRGGGYHFPIALLQQAYFTHITENPLIEPDQDAHAQNILYRLKETVLQCNKLYPKA